MRRHLAYQFVGVAEDGDRRDAVVGSLGNRQRAVFKDFLVDRLYLHLLLFEELGTLRFHITRLNLLLNTMLQFRLNLLLQIQETICLITLRIQFSPTA